MDIERDLVVLNEETQQPMTTSLTVAEVFGKRHADIIRSIQRIDCSEEFTERNFALSVYQDSTGRNLPQYELTKDGFTFLAMGFTGSKAAQFKESYIVAFNAMEKQLLKQSNQFPVPQTFKDALLLAAQQQDLLEEKQAKIEEDAPKVRSYEKLQDTEGLYS